MQKGGQYDTRMGEGESRKRIEEGMKMEVYDRVLVENLELYRVVVLE